ncbi:MAG: T9SS type A sorting domain-containing protein [Bacteroidetes bacterium]|nr:T9SS type A sorting domain-containing protein [Bacteroidota bacterium]MBP7477981.1 T9SS type A sorting domain-containing protein [Chitinophagales bacterium]
MYKLICVFVLSLASNLIFGQNYIADSIEFNPSTEIGYYSIESGTFTKKAKQTWDIGFGNNAHEYTIKINDIGGVRLWKTKKAVADFASVSLADTINEKFNAETFCLHGAFDNLQYDEVISGGNTFYQTGWSLMNMASHNGIGDSAFIIKTIDNIYKKLYVSYFVSPSRQYKVQIANIDGTNAKELVINKNNTDTISYYSYYSITNEAYVATIEEKYNNYDLVFRELISNGIKKAPAILTNNSYSILASLTSPFSPYKDLAYIYAPAYRANGVAYTAAIYNNSLGNRGVKTMNDIGLSWLDVNTQKPLANNSYFVRDRKSCIWQFVVTDYSNNAGLVKVKFLKSNLNRCPYGLKVYNYASENIFYPNPIKSNELLNFNLNIDWIGTNFSIVNIAGLEVMSGTNNGPLDISNLAKSIYFVKLIDNQKNIINIQKLIIE